MDHMHVLRTEMNALKERKDITQIEHRRLKERLTDIENAAAVRTWASPGQFN